MEAMHLAFRVPPPPSSCALRQAVTQNHSNRCCTTMPPASPPCPTQVVPYSHARNARPNVRRGEGDILIDNPPFGRIYHAAVIESTGRFLYDLPAMTERAGAVALAISRDGKVALMHHWRPLPAKDPSQSASFLTIGAARGVWSLEVPRGFPNGAEDCGDTARREAQEELGVVVSNVVHLGFCNFNTSVLLSDIPIYAVLAHPDRPASNKRDESEVIRRVAWMSFQEAFACVARGEVRCGLTLAALSHLVASKQKIDDLILTCDVN